MSSRSLFPAAVLCLAASVSYADGACDKAQSQYRNAVFLVDSLRPEKPGQMRVFAVDGSEFNAGQVQWMKGQLRKLDKLCARGGPGDALEADRVLAGVDRLLESHRRRS
jgi:hypothetical protein